MGKNMCSDCSLPALYELLERATYERKRWVEQEDDLKAQIAEEEGKIIAEDFRFQFPHDA